jgi:hypothetical protein
VSEEDERKAIYIKASDNNVEQAYALMSIVMRGSNKEWGNAVKELSDRLKKAFGDRLDRFTWRAVLKAALQAFSYAYRGWSYTVAHNILIPLYDKVIPRDLFTEVVRIGWCFGAEVRRERGGKGAEDQHFRRDYEEKCVQSR